MGIFQNFKRRSEEEKETFNMLTEGLPPVEKVIVKSALKFNFGSSIASRFLGAVVDTIKEAGKEGKDEKE